MTVTNQQVLDELKKIESQMATKEDISSLKTTIEIMSNPDTMKQIAESSRDIIEGRTKHIHSVKDMLNEQ